MEKQRLFVDMDGTLAVFQKVDTLEALYEQGYFLDLPPIENVLNSVKTIIQNNPGIEVNVLSAVIADSEFALSEKNAWLDKYLPEIDNSRRIFTRCGEDKKDFIPSGIRPNDFLLDDYTNNLTLWQPPARGIKLLNGINHTNGTWQHDCLRFDKPANELAENIVSIMQGGERIVDRRPEIKEVNFMPHAKEEERLTGIPKHIKLEGRTNRWSAVDEKVIDDKTFYLMENDVYGDETDFVIIDQNKNIICEDVYNGFEEDEFVEYLSTYQGNDTVSNIVGRINFLGTDGTIGYTTEYSDVAQMREEIRESDYIGRPITAEWDIELPKKLITDMHFFELQEHLFYNYDISEIEATDLASAIKIPYVNRTNEQVKLMVDFWNKNIDIGITFREFLGMTESEYSAWTLTDIGKYAIQTKEFFSAAQVRKMTPPNQMVDVLMRNDDAVLLNWHGKNLNEYSAHHIDYDNKGVNTGKYLGESPDHALRYFFDNVTDITKLSYVGKSFDASGKNINFDNPVSSIDKIMKMNLLSSRIEIENEGFISDIIENLPKDEFMEHAYSAVHNAEIRDVIRSMIAGGMLSEEEIDGVLMERNILDAATNMCNRNNIYNRDEKIEQVIYDISIANIEKQIKQDLFNTTELSYEVKSVINDFSHNNQYDRLKILCDYIRYNPILTTLQVCDIADTISDIDDVEKIKNLPIEKQYSELSELTNTRIGEADKFCLNAGHCMPQTNISLENQFIILKPQALRGESRNAENQVCFATGGFGCEPNSRGRAVFAENIFDGDKARWNSDDIIGIADKSKLPDYIQKEMSSFLETRENTKSDNSNNQDLER